MNTTLTFLALINIADFQGILMGVVMLIIIAAMVVTAVLRARDVKKADEVTHDRVESALHSDHLQDTKVKKPEAPPE